MSQLRFACVPFSALVLLGGGCATFQETGAAAGGMLGAATGAIVGSQTGDAAPGALIGGALGAVTGSLVGAGMDETDRRNEARIAAATAPTSDPVSIADVVQMSQSGIGDDLIISSIRSAGMTYQISAADVVNLHNQGVSDRVIQVMLDSNRTKVVHAPTPVVVRQSAPVYVVEPPPHVSVGFGYRRRYHRHHCW